MRRVPRKRVDVSGYDRTRRGRAERIRGYTREQESRTAAGKPSMLALRRSRAREAAVESAIKELGVIQRRANSRNSTAPFREAVDDLMASLRRGDPNVRMADSLAVHTATARSKEEFPGIVALEMEFAEDNPGYVAHGYITTIPGAYDRLTNVQRTLSSAESAG